jgi:hypothetical protein
MMWPAGVLEELRNAALEAARSVATTDEIIEAINLALDGRLFLDDREGRGGDVNSTQILCSRQGLDPV